MQQKLKELYLNNWNVEVDALRKCLNYGVYKKEHKLENYSVKLSPSLCIFYNRFRCMNHRFPIEFGRFVNIERAKRMRKLCQSAEIGDEYHYSLIYMFFFLTRLFLY